MTLATKTYLVPAISRLPGLVAYYVGISTAGSMVHVSLWDSDRDAQGMATLKEMTDTAAQQAAALGVQFIPIVNYPISWRI